MDIHLLVKVCSRAWSLNILALFHSGVPGRQAPLLAATSASRTAFSASLEHLVDLELVERNPGYGHPLRPEFRLTAKGTEVAKIAGRIMECVTGNEQSNLLRKSWTVPVLALTEDPRHFSELKSLMAPITDRALSQSLQSLEQVDWLNRVVDPSQRPLRPHYVAKNEGLKIGKAINIAV